jgi:hypothetical protein
MFEPAPGDGGEYVHAADIVDSRPDTDFVDGAEAAGAQAAPLIHFANVDAGGGEHQMIM